MKKLVEDAESDIALLGNFPADVRGIFGENPVINSEDDIPTILKNAALKKASGILLPKLYMMCGTADFIYQHSADTHKLLDDLQIDHIYEEFPDAIHEWGVWDKAVERFMRHFLDVT
jgi:S-formylglutathione hydrolase FrmB